MKSLLKNSPITADYLGQLVLIILLIKISGKIAKDVFEEMFNNKKITNDYS